MIGRCSNEARALSTFCSLSAGLEPDCIRRIKNNALTEKDREDFEVRQANAAWNDYLTETHGVFEDPGHFIHIPA